MCKNGNPRKIDKCIRHLIANLNSHGVATIASCCGHGKYPMSIVVMSLRSTKENFDIVSNVTIPRKSKFYVKDKTGQFYIHETLEVVQ